MKFEISKREQIEWLNYWIEDANKFKKRILMIGDSVTRDLRKYVSFFVSDTFSVDLLAYSYGFIDSKFIEELKSYLNNSDYDYDKIILNLGGHHGYLYDDCLESEGNVFEGVISEVIKFTKAKCNELLYVLPTYERKNDRDNSDHNKIIKQRNCIIKKILEEQKIDIIDINHTNIVSRGMYVDWCHLNDMGNEMFALEILKSLSLENKYVELNRLSSYRDLYEMISTKENIIWIYGSGEKGNTIRNYVEKEGGNFRGYIVSDQFYGAEDEMPYSYYIQNRCKNDVVIVSVENAEVLRNLNTNIIKYYTLSKELYTYMKVLRS